MTYMDAAITVLRTARRPMTTRELTEAALRKRLINPSGQTPEATMSAVLYMNCQDVKGNVIQRQFTPGPARAARGSVRWSLRSTSEAGSNRPLAHPL